MSYHKILEICNKYSDCEPFQVGEKIRSRDVIQKSFIVQSHERIVAFLDTSVSPEKEGLLIGEYGVYWKNTPVDDLVYISWMEMKNLKINSVDWMTTRVGNSYIFTGNHYLGRKSKSVFHIKRFLTSIQNIIRDGKIEARELNRLCIQYHPSDSLFYFLPQREKREVKRAFSIRDEDSILACLKSSNVKGDKIIMAFCSDALYIREDETGKVKTIKWKTLVHEKIYFKKPATLFIGNETHFNVSGIQLGQCIGVHTLLNEIVTNLFSQNSSKGGRREDEGKLDSFYQKQGPKDQKLSKSLSASKQLKENNPPKRTRKLEQKKEVLKDPKRYDSRFSSDTQYDVFLSHSTKDQAMVNAICQILEGRGIRCWYAPRDILPGTKWPAAISKAIGECKIFLLVLSKQSNSSDQVEREVQIASEEKKLILPFRIEEVELSGYMRYFVTKLHWMNALKGSREKELEQLAIGVESIMDRLQDKTKGGE